MTNASVLVVALIVVARIDRDQLIVFLVAKREQAAFGHKYGPAQHDPIEPGALEVQVNEIELGDLAGLEHLKISHVIDARLIRAEQSSARIKFYDLEKQKQKESDT